MVALYNVTDGGNWTNNTNWLTNEPLSAWYGVTTDASGSAIRLYLANNGLSGSLPGSEGPHQLDTFVPGQEPVDWARKSPELSH